MSRKFSDIKSSIASILFMTSPVTLTAIGVTAGLLLSGGAAAVAGGLVGGFIGTTAIVHLMSGIGSGSVPKTIWPAAKHTALLPVRLATLGIKNAFAAVAGKKKTAEKPQVVASNKPKGLDR